MNVPTTRQTHLIEQEHVINVSFCKMFINADGSAEQKRNRCALSVSRTGTHALRSLACRVAPFNVMRSTRKCVRRSRVHYSIPRYSALLRCSDVAGLSSPAVLSEFDRHRLQLFGPTRGAHQTVVKPIEKIVDTLEPTTESRARRPYPQHLFVE